MNNRPTSYTQQDHAVMLPCTPDQFSNFISGLLGKPQTITQGLKGSFDISLNDLVNIHRLIDQRIRQQNQGELIQFTARVIFDDDSSVLLNSLDDLQHYNEVRPIVSRQVHLSWAYLIRFADRPFPEKQSIDLSFLTIPSLKFDEDDFVQVLVSRNANNVSFRIQHTARTWGADIQSLLENHLRGMITAENPFRKFVRSHSSKFELGMFATIMISILASIYQASQNVSFARKSIVDRLLLKNISVEAKLNGILETLSNHFSSNFQIYSIAYIIGALIFSVFMMVIFESSINSTKPSFIRLTSMSDRYRENRLNGYRKKWFAAGASFVGSIVTGIISSIIYTNFWGG